MLPGSAYERRGWWQRADGSQRQPLSLLNGINGPAVTPILVNLWKSLQKTKPS